MPVYCITWLLLGIVIKNRHICSWPSLQYLYIVRMPFLKHLTHTSILPVNTYEAKCFCSKESSSLIYNANQRVSFTYVIQLFYTNYLLVLIEFISSHTPIYTAQYNGMFHVPPLLVGGFFQVHVTSVLQFTRRLTNQQSIVLCYQWPSCRWDNLLTMTSSWPLQKKVIYCLFYSRIINGSWLLSNFIVNIRTPKLFFLECWLFQMYTTEKGDLLFFCFITIATSHGWTPQCALG